MRESAPVDWLTSSPELLGRLRTTILNLAVTGRLLPDSDGRYPSGDRARDAWMRATVGDVTECLDRLRRPITKVDRKPGSIPYYGASTIVDYVSDHLFDEPLVLVGEDGAKWGAGEATAFRIDGKAWVNNHAHVLRPDRNVITDRFLELSLVAQDLNEFVTGMTVPKLTQARLNSIALILPPLAEQHHIVAKVDELMALCDRLEARQQDAEAAHTRLVQVLLDSLTKARDAEKFQAAWERVAGQFEVLFTTEASVGKLYDTVQSIAVSGRLVPQSHSADSAHKLLDQIKQAKSPSLPRKGTKQSISDIRDDRIEPYSIPLSWCWTTANDVCAEIIDCPHSTPLFVVSGILCLDTNSIKQGRIVGERSRYVTESVYLERTSRLTPRAGDIVFSREGVVGQSVVVPKSTRCCLGQRVMLFRPLHVLPEYLQLALTEPRALARHLSVHRGIGVKHVNVGDMRRAMIPLPPLEEQHRIIRKLKEVQKICDSLVVSIGNLRRKHTQLAEALVTNAMPN